VLRDQIQALRSGDFRKAAQASSGKGGGAKGKARSGGSAARRR
jgi:hypothetical protein